MTDVRHPIIFTGAGPGDPELITVKGKRSLEEADLVIFAGSLVPEELLVWTREGCECLSSASMDLDGMVEKMAEGHRAGKKVVRLHTGDPSLYGAIDEQMRDLDKLGVPYTVIPGVTAAFGAAAAMKMEYTLPEVTQTLILTRAEGRTPVPEGETLDALASHGASMAIYLSSALAEKVSSQLAAHYGEESTCAVAYRVSQPDERIIYTTIGKLPETMKNEGIRKTALIIVGKGVGDHNAAKSKLYDATFTHEYRDGVEKA
ncbi:precorrin-4 C(11)-methyltransferase [Desulfoluna butyratoxydans]|uniref:Tetrapyrrole methylase n=1 Tax=Desulfoluna butyratoxydans TaxID=231438 RepID=A0A4U8YUZ9_9BACT|nr:precorrin-4 C(11)-methyltransferase [Desulfoluna butyratoxydans]VFQ47249.1 tetrapyrrole methylase [Desulfoluna butyratoxydans]